MSSTDALRTIADLIVPLDESQASVRALPIAISLAERLGARVELLGVVSGGERSAPLRDRLCQLARESGTPVESSDVVESDDIAKEVGERARLRPRSAIVMSSRGPSRTSGLLTESHAAELLADGLPIVIVGPQATERATDLPVVACLDGSIESEQVIPVAATWARSLRVPLVLTVVTRPHLDSIPTTSHDPDRGGFDPEAALQLAVSSVTAGWPDLQVISRVTSYPWNVADALSISLERHPAQLVAVATHIRDGWSRLIHPSTTARIVSQLAAPVLVVPIERAVEEERAPGTPESTPAPATPAVRPFDEIIVPIAPDRTAVDAAVATANNLAASADAVLSFLSCNEDPARHEENERQRAELTDLLHPTRTRWLLVDSSNIADAIIDAATAAPESVVCLSSGAPGQLVDTLMPTTTGQVIRWSPQTVVLVGPHCMATEGPYSSIAAWVDGSLISEAVAELTGLWARAFGLPAHVLQVVGPETTTPARAPSAPGTSDVLRIEWLVITTSPLTGETIETAKTPATAIREWAETHADALLVMASHGAGLSEHVLGGVVMDVVRHVPTPVVVVPAHAIGDRIRSAAATPTTGTVDDEFAIEMDKLDPPTCWGLMTGVGFGRVAFTHDEQPLSLPVNCAVADHTIVFRTAQDSMLHELGEGAAVGFEMDRTDRIAESGWSVLVTGRAFEITDTEEQERLAEFGIHPWAPGDRNRWMRIVPSAITGRKIQRHRVTDETLPYMPPD